MPFVFRNTRDALMQYNIRAKFIGVDNNVNAIGQYFSDSFFTVPRGSDSSYVNAIIEIVKQNKVNVLVPTSDEESISLSGIKEVLLEYGCHCICPDSDAINLITDKYNTFRLLKTQQCNYVEQIKIDNAAELLSKLESWDKRYDKYIVKPCRDRGGRGVFCISRHAVAETDRARQSLMCKSDFIEKIVKKNRLVFPVLLMDYLNEPVCDADVLVWDNRIHRIITRRRVNPYYPNAGHVLFNDSAMTAEIKKALNALVLNGLYDFDIMFDKDNRPVIIEINPRPSGSMAVSMAAGAPLVAELVLLIYQHEFEMSQISSDQTVMPFKELKVVQ